MTHLQSRTRWSVLTAVFVATSLFALSTAHAEDDEKERKHFEDTIHVIQKKPVLEKNRLEVTPRFGMSINDPIYRSFAVGSNANFHLSERFYIGGLFEWFDFGDAIGGTTKTFDRAVDETRTQADAPVLNWFGALEAGYTPIYGKFTLFNISILYYNIGATLGAGYLDAESLTTASAGGFGATGSIVGRLFLNDWMAFDLEVRDHLFQANLQGGEETPISNIVTAAAGFSFYIPPTFEYSTGSEESD